MSHLLENMTHLPHSTPTPCAWSYMGGGLDVTTPFGEHNPPPLTHGQETRGWTSHCSCPCTASGLNTNLWVTLLTQHIINRNWNLSEVFSEPDLNLHCVILHSQFKLVQSQISDLYTPSCVCSDKVGPTRSVWKHVGFVQFWQQEKKTLTLFFNE